MINYIEKGIELHEEIARQGYLLYQEDGTWKSDNDTEVQKIIDSFIPVIDLQPQWDNFNLQMMSSPRFNQVYNQVVKNAPVVATALPVALDQVTTKGLSLFTIVWNQLCLIGGATSNDRQEWSQLAINNNLPEDFVVVLRGS